MDYLKIGRLVNKTLVDKSLYTLADEQTVLAKLKAYEDAEEEHRLLPLELKIGQWVWKVRIVYGKWESYEVKVAGINIDKNNVVTYYDDEGFSLWEWFDTKEKADKAIPRMQKAYEENIKMIQG